MRTSENLSACFAIFGKISLIWMPGTLVLIGWNGPRISAGAFGFMSHVSSWLGPPTRNSMMQLTSGSFAPCFLGAEIAGQRQPERGERAGVEKIAARGVIAERSRRRGIETDHGTLPE